MLNFLKRFRQSREGALTVEFTLLVPIYVFALLGSFVIFDALLTYNKASKANATVANLISRVGNMDSQLTQELFDVYRSIAYSNENDSWLRVSVVRNVSGDLRVRWSEERGGSRGVLTNDSPLLDQYIPNVVDGDEWVFIETARTFQPAMTNIGLVKTDFTHRIAFIPRFSGQLNHDELVDFADNYDGSTEPGDPEDVTFTPAPTGGDTGEGEGTTGDTGGSSGTTGNG